MFTLELPEFPIGTVVYDISPGQYFECWGTRFVVTAIKFDTRAKAYDYEICDLAAFERALRDGMPLSNGDRTDGYSEDMLDTRPRKGAGLDHDVNENPVFVATRPATNRMPFRIGDIVTTDHNERERDTKRTVQKIEDGQSSSSGIMITTVDANGATLRCDAGWYKLHQEEQQA